MAITLRPSSFTLAAILVTLSPSFSSSTSTSLTGLLGGARSFAAAVDAISQKAEVTSNGIDEGLDAAEEAKVVKALAEALDKAFSAYFELEKIISAKVILGVGEKI